jgi:hypothetical protein
MRKKTHEDHYRDGEVAIHIARQALAKQAIKDQLRSQGLRQRFIKPDEITAYLEHHPKLWFSAWERAWHSGRIDESVGVILREICRRRSVPDLYITPSWPEPLPERKAKRRSVTKTDDAKTTTENTEKNPTDEPPIKGCRLLNTN